MQVNETLLRQLKQLRRDIHRHPEISGEEQETAARIKEFIAQYKPDRVITGTGGTGMIFIFEGQKAGPTVMIRAELDALPIQEVNDIPYRSEYNGRAHLCGHDGHMTMVAALAAMCSERRPESGRVALMFQPAEETGEGAARMLEDKSFIKPDYIFALHNLPGFPKNEIIIKQGVFASASKGLIIALTGKTSHAAEPEHGMSPVAAVAELLTMIEQVPGEIKDMKDFALATVVHVSVGDKAFGVTPGRAVIMTTIRACYDEDLINLEKTIRKQVRTIADKHRLQVQIDDTEIFSSTVNDTGCCGFIKDAAGQLGRSVTEARQPFRWSEDFGLFTQKFKGALFGLGAGETTPDLHNPDYDFPESIIETGVSMFYVIIDKLLNKNNA